MAILPTTLSKLAMLHLNHQGQILFCSRPLDTLQSTVYNLTSLNSPELVITHGLASYMGITAPVPQSETAGQRFTLTLNFGTNEWVKEFSLELQHFRECFMKIGLPHQVNQSELRTAELPLETLLGVIANEVFQQYNQNRTVASVAAQWHVTAA